MCAHVHNHPLTGPPGAVQGTVIVSPSPVTVDTVLLVPVGCIVTLEEFGQEELQPVNVVSLCLFIDCILCVSIGARN